MPEWYNPAYTRYATKDCPGGPPKNPYTNEVIEYTGYTPVDDFVTDIQLPQMRQLAYEYETELMWCDKRGANKMTIFAADWLNWARDQGREVTFNDRCGVAGDFGYSRVRFLREITDLLKNSLTVSSGRAELINSRRRNGRRAIHWIRNLGATIT